MKKVFAIVLTALMVVSMFAGCGSKTEPTATTAAATTVPAAQTETAAAQTEAPVTEAEAVLTTVEAGKLVIYQ